MAQVPVLDLKLNCGSTAVEVSLWRDEALTELINGDTVELTHLRPNSKQNGRIQFNSSTHTTVKISERRLIEEMVEVVRVSSGVIVLLGEDYEEYVVPDTMYAGDVEDLVEQLPLKMKIKHINNWVLSINE